MECRGPVLEDEDGVGLVEVKIKAAGDTACGRLVGMTAEGRG